MCCFFWNWTTAFLELTVRSDERKDSRFDSAGSASARAWTQEQLAELADLNLRIVQKIEDGKLNILLTTILRLHKSERITDDSGFIYLCGNRRSDIDSSVPFLLPAQIRSP